MFLLQIFDKLRVVFGKFHSPGSIEYASASSSCQIQKQDKLFICAFCSILYIKKCAREYLWHKQLIYGTINMLSFTPYFFESGTTACSKNIWLSVLI